MRHEIDPSDALAFLPAQDYASYLAAIARASLVLDPPGFSGGATSLDALSVGTPILSWDGAMARGRQDASAMEMTKWFDTNYHYIVPELDADTQFVSGSSKALDEYNEAKFLGVATRPVLIGPVTFLKLARLRDGSDRWALLPKILPLYAQMIGALAQAGAQ